MKRLDTYSQNFLKSPRLVRELISKSNLRVTDTVYDLGAGSGLISSVLADAVKKVVAVEYDRRLKPTLEKNLSEHRNVTITFADALTIPLPTSPYKVFANIPFHISSPLVQRFFNSDSAPQAAYLIVQRQFGRKLEATDTRHFTSQLGMLIGAEYAVKGIKNLNKSDYTPAPAVETMCIEMVKRKIPLVEHDRLEAYKQFTTECFSDPKKLAKMPLHVIGASEGASPSRLSLTQWVILFNSQKVY